MLYLPKPMGREPDGLFWKRASTDPLYFYRTEGLFTLVVGSMNDDERGWPWRIWRDGHKTVYICEQGHETDLAVAMENCIAAYRGIIHA